jgi:hypothetical protein
VVTASNDHVFHVWEFPGGKEIRRFGPGVTGSLPPAVRWRPFELPAALSADGKVLAYHFDGDEIVLYDVATGQHLTTLPEKGPFSFLAFSPDGRHLAVRDWFGQLTLWDWKARQSQQIAVSHEFLIGEAPGLVYSSDGRLLAMTANQSPGSSTLQLVDPGRLTRKDRMRLYLVDNLPKTLGY